MGNCLQRTASEDVDLLEGDESDHRLRGNSGPCNEASHIADQIAEPAPVYYPTNPNVGRPASQLTEEEQIKIAQRIGMIQHLPIDIYTEEKRANRECVICMLEFQPGEKIRYLPCAHTYHVDCIDDWLMRSFACPSCMEPVDAALLTTYEGYLNETNAFHVSSLRSTGSRTEDSLPSSLDEREQSLSAGGKGKSPLEQTKFT